MSSDPINPTGTSGVCGVIIVAGGRGQRLGGAVPKQFLDLGGRSILQRSVAAFDRFPGTAHVVVVLPPELVVEGPTLVGAVSHGVRFAAGGDRRQDSVQAGLRAMPADATVILIHDAARPFVDEALIERVAAAAVRTGAAVPAMQARDTVKRAGAGGGLVAGTIAREEIWMAQTPQGFRRDVLEQAIAHAGPDTDATDEALIVERAGKAVEIVAGDPRNFKITTADDLTIARMTYTHPPRVGTGYDLHRLVPDRPLVLAGVVLPFERGPLGHSDGDVVCHSLADAMFGAAGLGDIGQHFPNTDPRWKDVAGLDLLTRAVEILRERGWRVASADVTVVLERPKLVPHLVSIREHVAAVLGIEPDRVSVKGKTNEGVDAVGRGEAIAAHAVAVIVAEGAWS